MDKEQLSTEHQGKQEAVMRFFNDVLHEVQVIFFAKDCEKVAGARVQAIIAFTFADILSNFWDCYINEKNEIRSPTAKLEQWFKSFCETDKNNSFKNNPYFKALGLEPLSNLRHSLVHFFGMSPQKPGKYITLASSDMDEKTFENYKTCFNKDMSVLKPIDLYFFFRDGGSLMLEAMISNNSSLGTHEAREWEHIKGIHRIFQKFYSEGAMQILITKEEKVD